MGPDATAAGTGAPDAGADPGAGSPPAQTTQSTLHAAMDYLDRAADDPAPSPEAPAPALASEPGQPGQPAPVASGTAPAGEFADIEQALGEDPRKGAFLGRLGEVASKRDEFKSQLDQLTPFQELIAGFTEAGWKPEDVWAALQQQEPEAAPAQQQVQADEAFHEYLYGQGVDPEALDANQYNALRAQWGMYSYSQAQEQAVQTAEWRQNLSQQMEQAKGQFPVLANEELQRIAYGAFGTIAEEGGTLQDAAGWLDQGVQSWFTDQLGKFQQGQPADPRFETAIKTLVEGEVARYAAAKTADAQVPVTAGGAAPAPTERPNVSRMTQTERERAAYDYLNAGP